MMLTPSFFWRAQLAARSPIPVSISAFSSAAPDQKLSSASFSSRRGPMRGVPSEATASEEVEFVVADIGLTPKVGGKGRSDTSGFRSGNEARAESQPHHRDTPPVDVYVVEAGLLARGSMLLSGLPETLAGFSDIGGRRLAAYSCGGSSGFTPASLLASGKLPEEPRRSHLPATRRVRQLD